MARKSFSGGIAIFSGDRNFQRRDRNLAIYRVAGARSRSLRRRYYRNLMEELTRSKAYERSIPKTGDARLHKDFHLSYTFHPDTKVQSLNSCKSPIQSKTLHRCSIPFCLYFRIDVSFIYKTSRCKTIASLTSEGFVSYQESFTLSHTPYIAARDTPYL